MTTDTPRSRRIRSYEEAIGIMLLQRSVELAHRVFDDVAEYGDRRIAPISRWAPDDINGQDYVFAWGYDTDWVADWVRKQVLDERLSPRLGRLILAECPLAAWTPNQFSTWWSIPEAEGNARRDG